MPGAQKRKKAAENQKRSARLHEAKDSSKKNEEAKLLTVPGEIRNTIYSMVLRDGANLLSDKFTVLGALPREDYTDNRFQEGVLSTGRQLRAEGLRYIIGGSRIQIFFPDILRYVPNCYSGPPRPDFRREPPDEIIKQPKIVFQCARDLDLQYKVTVRTHRKCRYHRVLVCLRVIGDTYSCRVWWNDCEDSQACDDIMYFSVKEIRAGLIGMFLNKAVVNMGGKNERLKLVEDTACTRESPRYNEAWSRGLMGGFKWELRF